MKSSSLSLKKFLDKWPGKTYFGMYRFLPIFFVLGAALEFSMINWQVGETNFYKTFKRRQAKNFVQHLLEEQVAAVLTMMAGSQVVHMYYRPLKDLDKYIENELKQHK